MVKDVLCASCCNCKHKYFFVSSKVTSYNEFLKSCYIQRPSKTVLVILFCSIWGVDGSFCWKPQYSEKFRNSVQEFRCQMVKLVVDLNVNTVSFAQYNVCVDVCIRFIPSFYVSAT